MARGLGTSGASALVRSAGSIATQLNDYKDKMAALQWSSSAQNESDFQTYRDYLSSRINNLNSTGKLSDASRALTLSSSLQSANRSYVSNTIQRTTIGILEVLSDVSLHIPVILLQPNGHG